MPKLYAYLTLLPGFLEALLLNALYLNPNLEGSDRTAQDTAMKY